jgi:hypothetical protein
MDMITCTLLSGPSIGPGYKYIEKREKKWKRKKKVNGPGIHGSNWVKEKEKDPMIVELVDTGHRGE